MTINLIMEINWLMVILKFMGRGLGKALIKTNHWTLPKKLTDLHILFTLITDSQN
jgi:hypothetical protein